MKISRFDNKYNQPFLSSVQMTKSYTGSGISDKSLQTHHAGKQCDSSYFYPNINYQISFGALKKSAFKGIDLAVVERFKAPIEKFNSSSDFETWAGKEVEKIVNTNYSGRNYLTRDERKRLLAQWFDYVLKENDAYNNGIALLVLQSITKNLAPDTDTLPPALNKGVLADCISEIDNNIKNDKHYQFDFNKIYETKLKSLYLKNTQVTDEKTGWVVIPSKKHDYFHFKTNVEKLQLLSHHNWCTKTFNAEPYLKNGDFHIYLNNGKPEIGIRFINDTIEEIQCPENNNKINTDSFPILNKYLKEIPHKLSEEAEYEIQQAADAFKLYQQFKAACKEENVEKVLDCLNIAYTKDNDGLYVLRDFEPSNVLSNSKSMHNLQFLFDKIKEIQSSANFSNIKADNLGNIIKIGGSADFENSNIQSLGKLKEIGGGVNFKNSKIKSLENVTNIGGSVKFCDTEINDIGSLVHIGGDADFRYSQITDLKGLKRIGQNADFRHSMIEDTGCLESIGGIFLLDSSSKIKDLKNIKEIGGSVLFSETEVESLGELRRIGGICSFTNSKIKSLNKLQSIGNIAIFSNSNVEDLGELTYAGNANFSNSKIKSLGNLKEIRNDADFHNSDLQDLGKLEYIGSSANFSNTKITNTGLLKEIGNNAIFKDCGIEELTNLEKIGHDAIFSNSEIKNLAKLHTIGGEADFSNTKQLKSLGNLTNVNSLTIDNSEIRDLGRITEIPNDLNMRNGKVRTLGNLERIGGTAVFDDSLLSDLGQLKEIGGNAHFSGSQVKSLKNLARIGGDTYISGSKITDTGALKTTGSLYINNESELKPLGNIEETGNLCIENNSVLEDLGKLRLINGYAEFSGCKQLKSLGNLTKIKNYASFENSSIESLGKLQYIGGSADFSDSAVTDTGELETINCGVTLTNCKLTPEDFKNVTVNGHFWSEELPEETLLRKIIKKRIVFAEVEKAF